MPRRHCSHKETGDMETQRLIQGLCSELQHPEAASACVKKLVVENWLDKADDLRYVPPTRLEGWGMPLKMVNELYEYLADEDATKAVNSANSFVRYNVRPFTDLLNPRGLVAVLKDDALKRQKPDEWAARKLQRAFRRRQQQRLQDLARPPADDVVSEWLDGHDFSRRSDKDAEERRMGRADAALKKHLTSFVRVWRERRRQESMAGGAGHLTVVGARTVKNLQSPHCTLSIVGSRSLKTTVTIGGDEPESAATRRVDVQAGDAIELEVWDKDQGGKKTEVLGKAMLRVKQEHFLRGEWADDLPLSFPSSRLSLRKATVQVRIETIHAAVARIGELPGDPLKGIEAALARLHKGRPKRCPVTELMYRLGSELKREDHEITPLVHRLVTLNWLEEVRDLELAEDRHWERWGFPEKLVVLIKAELLERSEETFFKSWENVTSSMTNGLTSIFTWT